MVANSDASAISCQPQGNGGADPARSACNNR